MVEGKIAIILARGGSKRIPRKNIIDFAGKPMVAWTIEAAISSNCFENVVVSTDDEEIASIAKIYGAEVPFLRTEAFDDHATSSEATIATLLKLEKYWSKRFDIVAQLMSNCPLRDNKDVRNLMLAFESSKPPAQISVFKYGFCNPWWAIEISNEGKPIFLHKDAIAKRSQDLPELYCPTGALWIANRNELVKHKTFYCKDHVVEPLSWTSSIDIDEYTDLKIAEACYELKKTGATSSEKLAI